jgi:hypothetical protein
MQDDDNVYRDTVVRLCELAGDTATLQGLGFINCEIRGPAVLVGHESIFDNNTWRGNPDAVLWEVPWERQNIIGAIQAVRCSFEECTFIGVGYAGRPEAIQQIKEQSRWP